MLKTVDLRMLGRQWLERNKAKKPNVVRWGPLTVDLDIRTGNALACWATATRDAIHRHEPISSMHVADAFHDDPRFDARTALRPVPLEEVLTITRQIKVCLSKTNVSLPLTHTPFTTSQLPNFHRKKLPQ